MSRSSVLYLRILLSIIRRTRALPADQLRVRREESKVGSWSGGKQPCLCWERLDGLRVLALLVGTGFAPRGAVDSWARMDE